MIRKTLCLAFLLALALPLLAFPANPFFRFARDSAAAEGGLWFANDAFGPGPVGEWDDLDSYGFRFALPLPAGLVIGTVYDGLTNRGVDGLDATRIDVLSACLGFESMKRLLPWLDLGYTAFLGFRALGDFGAIALQEGWHSGQGIQRPVPMAYEAVDGISPLAGFDLRLSAPWRLAPSWSLDLEWAPGSSWLAFSSLGMSYSDGAGSMALALGWAFGGSDGGNATVGAVLDSWLGPALAFSAKVGYLSVELQTLALSGISSGSIGLLFSSSNSIRRTSPGAILRLSYGLVLGEAAAPGMRLEWISAGASPTLAGGFFAAIANGWIGKEAVGAAAPRFSEYSAGGMLELKGRGGRISADLGLGLRLSVEGLYALCLEKSNLLDQRMLLDLDLEGSLRFSLAALRSIPFGLGLKLRWTPLSLELLAADGDYSGRRRLEAQAFVFSAGR